MYKCVWDEIHIFFWLLLLLLFLLLFVWTRFVVVVVVEYPPFFSIQLRIEFCFFGDIAKGNFFFISRIIFAGLTLLRFVHL